MSDSKKGRGNQSNRGDGPAGGPENPAFAAAKRTLSGLRHLQMTMPDPRVRQTEADPEERKSVRRRLNQMEAVARQELEREQEALGIKPEVTTNVRATGGQPSNGSWAEPLQVDVPPADRFARDAGATGYTRDEYEQEPDEVAPEVPPDDREGRLSLNLSDSRVQTDLQTKLEESRRQLRQALDTNRAEARARQDALRNAAHERAALESALEASETRYKQAVEAHTAQRAAWDANHLELKAALYRATAELRQSIDAHVSEGEHWTETRQQLEAAVESAEGRFKKAAEAREAEFQDALDTAERERQMIVDRHQADQAAWNATRQVLERRVSQLESMSEAHAELEAALADAQTSLRQDGDQYATKRADWEARRLQLEAALNAAGAELKEALAGRAADRAASEAARQQLEADVARARQELAQLVAARDGFSADATAWDAARRKLESELDASRAAQAAMTLAREAEREAHDKALRDALEARTRIESALAKTQAELQNAMENQTADPAVWIARLQQLEAETNLDSADLDEVLPKIAAEGGRATDRASWDATRKQLAIWISTRRQLEGDLDGARAMFARADDTQDAAMMAREKELQRAIEARKKIEAALAKTQAERQQALEAHASERAVWQATRRELEVRLHQVETADGDRQQLQQALDQAQTKHAALLATYASLQRQLSDTTARLTQLSTESEALRNRPDIDFRGDSRTELEERLHQAQRLEEVGRLAGAMVPDINKLVSSIDLCGTELARGLDDSDPRREPARAIVSFSQRASGLLRQLLAFSEKQSRPLKTVDLNESVRRSEAVLARLVGADIDLTIHLGPSGVINAGEDDVEHLVTALVFSARDLLPVGGSLAIDTRRVELSDAASADGVLGHFVLSVSATGYGVQPAKASSALELVVQRCGAELFFDGSTDRGSVFEVRFPLARPDAHHVAPV